MIEACSMFNQIKSYSGLTATKLSTQPNCGTNCGTSNETTKQAKVNDDDTKSAILDYSKSNCVENRHHKHPIWAWFKRHIL